LGQPTADLTQADALETHPGEDLSHDPGLFLDHLEAGHAAADCPSDIAVAEGCRAERV
jgi:hypothetical protein